MNETMEKVFQEAKVIQIVYQGNNKSKVKRKTREFKKLISVYFCVDQPSCPPNQLIPYKHELFQRFLNFILINLYCLSYELIKWESIIQENKVDGGVMKDSINKTLQQTKENIEQNDPHKIFKDNEILICNFIFHREDQSSEWTITNVSQVRFILSTIY